MKRYLKKYTSLKLYIAFLRRQPKHMQHVYAFIFAGSVTALIASIILYVDYGFWHERYVRKDEIIIASSTEIISKPTPIPESPIEMLSRFIGEAKVQFDSISSGGQELLKGKEIYSNTEVSQ